MKDLLALLVRALASEPKNVIVEQTEDRSTIHLVVILPKEDMGRVIGKAGKTANAIRTLIGAMVQKDEKKIKIQFVESDSN